jgi:hypothetical protein
MFVFLSFLLNCVLFCFRRTEYVISRPFPPCVAWVPDVKLGELGNSCHQLGNSNSRASDVEPSPPRFARIKGGAVHTETVAEQLVGKILKGLIKIPVAMC